MSGCCGAALPALRSLSVARRSSGAVSVLIARNGHRGRKGVMSEVGATINCLSAGLSNLDISADLCKCPRTTIEMSKLERRINNGREIMTRHYELTGPVTQPPPGPVSRVRPRLSLSLAARDTRPRVPIIQSVTSQISLARILAQIICTRNASETRARA